MFAVLECAYTHSLEGKEARETKIMKGSKSNVRTLKYLGYFV